MTIEPFKVMCIDDTKIPNEIPKEQRVIAGEVYTAEGLVHLLSSKIIGIKIAEKPLDIHPYYYWGAYRFMEFTEDMLNMEEEIAELMKTDVIHTA
jgi:hypothetical protein